jgi:hypothetical protein
VNFDELACDRAQRLRGDALIVDESASAAIGQLNPAQNEAAIGLDVLRIRRREGWMVEAEFEDRGDLTLRLAFAHERAVAARAKRQGKGVEQNRFASAGLAGKNGEAAAKRKIELIDQDNVADGEVNQHPADVSPRASQPDFAVARRGASKPSRLSTRI